MKKLKLLFSIILLSSGLNTQAQNFTIQASTFEVCAPNSIQIMVFSSPPGAYNFVWFTGTPYCASAFNETIYANNTGIINTTTSGIYYCRAEVTGTGYVYSNLVAARIYPPNGSPVLLAQPVPHIVTTCYTELCIPLPNWTTTFDPTVKWYKNNAEIAGATSLSYTASATGYYKYAAQADCGYKFSDSVLVSPSIPQSQITAAGATTFCAGSSVVLNANTGTGLTYQWKTNTLTISGATNTSYTAASPGAYTVVVTNSIGCTALSNSIAVTVIVGQQLYTWTQKADFGGGLRYAAFSFSIANKGYAGLGVQWSNGAAVFGQLDIWEYDPATNVWTQKANFPGASRNAPTGFSIGSKGYVTTGWLASGQLKDTWEYDPALNTWTQKTDFGGSARYTATSFTIGNFAYVGTGYSPLTNDFWKYDPSNNSWTQIANVGGIARQAPSGFAIGNNGYVFGGGVQFGAHLNDLWQYDPATNTWTQKTSCPCAGRNGCAAFAINNKGYVGLGADDVNSFQDFFEYDPAMDKWTQIPDFSGGTRLEAISFSAGNKGYVGTGSSALYPNINLKQDLWELNVTCNIQSSITPSGSVAICQGSNVALSVPNVSCTAYQWKLNTANISGATNSTYIAAAAGSYTVVVTNSCGSATSSATTVTVNSLPSATITAGGTTTFCNGGSVALNAPVNANYSYQWKKGATVISGATLSSYTATTGGNYRVIVTNTVTGCFKTTGNAIIVTVNALPNATITPQGPTTFCAGGSVVLAANTGTGLTYKWKKGSSYISGATLSNYTATTGGNYRVEVTNNNSCSKTSGNVAVSVPCKEGETISSVNNFDFTVYPNPNSGEFTINFSSKPTSTIQIELTDEIGKVVKKFETRNETIVIKETNLSKGIYCLTAENKDKVVIKKINIVK